VPDSICGRHEFLPKLLLWAAKIELMDDEMERKIFNLKLIGIVFVLCSIFLNCSKGSSLSGTYLPKDDDAKNSIVNEITFNKDGTCTVDLDFLGKLGANYSISGNTVIITIQGIGIPYEIKGNTIVNDSTYGYEGTFSK